MNQKKYLVYLHSIWFSQRKLGYIFCAKKNYKEVYEGISELYLKTYGFTIKQTESILKKHSQISTKYLDNKISDLSVSLVTIHDPEYPDNLKQIANPPFLLYVRWKVGASPMFAVVGSRKISAYGKKNIWKIVSDISSDFTIVSGWAYGCDSEAHNTCLASKGNTCAVIGTGIDITYPQSNMRMYNDIVKWWWAIVSIFPIGEPGNGYNFPIRNEVISWMSIGLLVVEAAEKSGTLITARLALEQWRDVFAIPWEVGKLNSVWCNALLKNGEAKMVTCSEDIREEYSFLQQQKHFQRDASLTGMHKNIYDLLSIEADFWESIAWKLEKPFLEILPDFSLLEMKGILKKNIEGKYELCL